MENTTLSATETTTVKTKSQYVATVLTEDGPKVLTGRTQGEIKKLLNGLSDSARVLCLVKGKVFGARPRTSFDIVQDAH